MSDLLLKHTLDGGDIEFKANGDLRTSSGLYTAVYLSLFTSSWWGNAYSDRAERYSSRIPELMQRALTNQVRLDVIEAANDALSWMKEEGIVERVGARAFIRSSGRLDLGVTIYEPGVERGEEFAYSLNWDATSEAA